MIIIHATNIQCILYGQISLNIRIQANKIVLTRDNNSPINSICGSLDCTWCFTTNLIKPAMFCCYKCCNLAWLVVSVWLESDKEGWCDKHHPWATQLSISHVVVALSDFSWHFQFYWCAYFIVGLFSTCIWIYIVNVWQLLLDINN